MWKRVTINGFSNNPDHQPVQVNGYVRIAEYKKHSSGEKYPIYEVILVEKWNNQNAVTQSIVDFNTYESESTMGETVKSLAEDFKDRYYTLPFSWEEIALYCVDGWSRNSADKFITGLAEDDLRAYLSDEGVE